MSTLNHSLSRVLSEMGEMYRYLGAPERFRALAYARAARTIDNLKEDISHYIQQNTLEDIPGIGESIAEKIIEYTRRGRIKKYEELKKSVPFELMDLMSVSGFGPQSLKQIHDELGISTRAKLIRALEDGRISQLKGFGPKKVENMLRGLKMFKQSEERILYAEAKAIADQIVKTLSAMSEILAIEVAGSIRRGKETIGDIDILVACRTADRKKVIQRFVLLENRKLVLVRGNTKASIVVTDHHRQVDLRVVSEHEWGAALLYLTGSKEHNVQLRSLAKERGMKINEYGVFDLKTNKHMAGRSEEEVYKRLGFQFIPPELREMNGEIECAAKGKLPRLIEPHDIRGDMQMHSQWSDGTMDIATLAKFVRDHYPYEYIVLTDHSKSSRIAGGLDAKEFRKQAKEIDLVNKHLGRDFIKKGVEVDILPDGSLDLPDDLLMEMDWVCASIHSGFQRDNTARLVSACKHPYVHCIGHPSGRLIGKREAYKADWQAIFKVAAFTGTAMEINAQPQRLDLSDQLARQAIEAGVILTISTDSHAESHFSYMTGGVLVARRAWCESGHVLNTKSWAEVKKFTRQKYSLSKRNAGK